MVLRYIRAFSVLAIGLAAAASPVLAQNSDLRFAGIFGDHGVLQRDRPLHLWGTAPAHAKLTLNLNGQQALVSADAKGHWQADLPAMSAGGPYSLTATDAAGSTTLSDIMIGDVFLCTGQSNMQFPVKFATNAWNEVGASANANLRFINIDTASASTPQTELTKPASWRVAGPDSTGDASAVCYYMSKALQKEHGVPVGFIDSYWGGTTIQAWISAGALQRIGYHGHIEATQWAPNELSSLYNAMIAPLAPYTVKAIAWYQGESNTDNPQEYAQLLPTLMADWRGAFNRPDMPFLIVQLSSFGAPASQPGKSDWAAVREVQRRAVDADPHAALAVSFDFGDRNDIHPTEKTIVGNRLARAADAIAFGQAVTPTGPEATSVSRSGDDLVVHFRYAGAGLKTYSASTAIGFEACDIKDACHYVTAIPDGQTVVLKGADTPDTIKVRYAWADAPYVNLYSADDLPAVPFEMKIGEMEIAQ
ncbi:sialate O-acetylesterase [Asticcacaulis sp. EMRT-3]|uniref:sialate O-acetylesterase n=1 Tax=Asticcacaulis sp. EMRT-3 TaxID=3040349 RepID=UPI0024AF6E71|nr:sialate O-acetylesterase [Asticcacaulis sp. EMRT-3]MDI7775703.1 sialate O-acetylesterase [Asticcacaulis sp. EMRT-3]